MWTDRGAEPDGNTLNRARVKPKLGNPQTLSRDYKEAIGVATTDDATYYISDLGGSIRVVDLHTGADRELIRLGPSLTGIALADSNPSQYAVCLGVAHLTLRRSRPGDISRRLSAEKCLITGNRRSISAIEIKPLTNVFN